MDESPAVRAAVEKRVAGLGHLYDRVTSCRVTIETVGAHRRQGRLYGVHVDVTVPRGEVAVTHHADEDVYVAIRDAFDAVKRRLEDHVRRERGAVKQHAPLQHGRIARLSPDGFGFIEMADGREVYFARDNVVGPDFERLEVGAEVQFLEEPAAEGAQAKRVSFGKHRFG